MADTKISALSAETAAPGDEIPVNRGGVNYKITAGDILKQDSGTLTANAPALDLTQTWNNSGVTFTGLKFNATDTASASGSLLMDLESTGGSTGRLRFDKAGIFTLTGSNASIRARSLILNTGAVGNVDWAFYADGSTNNVNLRDTASLNWTNGVATLTPDTRLYRDDAGTLAQRNLTNAQTFRIYNTTDAGIANYERGFLKWDTNVLKIGTEKAGTGTARALELQTDGTTRLTIAANSTFTHTASGGEQFTISTNGAVTVGRSLTIASAQALFWLSRSGMTSPSDGVLRLTNYAVTDFNRLQFGGTTSSFPALKRSSTTLQGRLADDSAFCEIQGKLTTDTAYSAGAPTATGYIVLYDSTGTAYKVPAEAL